MTGRSPAQQSGGPHPSGAPGPHQLCCRAAACPESRSVRAQSPSLPSRRPPSARQPDTGTDTLTLSTSPIGNAELLSIGVSLCARSLRSMRPSIPMLRNGTIPNWPAPMLTQACTVINTSDKSIVENERVMAVSSPGLLAVKEDSSLPWSAESAPRSSQRWRSSQCKQHPAARCLPWRLLCLHGAPANVRQLGSARTLAHVSKCSQHH